MNKEDIKFNDFINDSVLEVTTNYYHLMDKTKKLYFKYLIQNNKPEEFYIKAQRIWENIDHTFMKDRLEEFNKMVKKRNLTGHPIINPNATYEEIYKLNPESKFIDTEIKYLDTIIDEYMKANKTLENEYIDKTEYLTKQVAVYDKEQMTVPYFNKNGTIRAYHDIASYCSMLYNVNLTRTGWNRTMYDAELLDNDLMYLVAHTFACPLCINAQGRIYSKSGKSKKYPSMEEAINGSLGMVGHPNCKHQWTIYWGEEQMQEDKFNTAEWEDKYVTKQKVLALERKYEKIDNDKTIYRQIGNNEKVDLIQMKQQKITTEIDDLKKLLK